MNICDCTAYCGDDPAIQTGKALPCSRAAKPAPRPAGAARAPQAYRLLSLGEATGEGDEFMDDDTVTWHPVRKGFCGHPWGGAWQPMRRAVEATQAAPS